MNSCFHACINPKFSVSPYFTSRQRQLFRSYWRTSKVSLYKANDSKAVTSQVFFPGIIPWLHLKDKLAIGVPVGAVELKVTFHQNIENYWGGCRGVYFSIERGVNLLMKEICFGDNFQGERMIGLLLLLILLAYMYNLWSANDFCLIYFLQVMQLHLSCVQLKNGYGLKLEPSG